MIRTARAPLAIAALALEKTRDLYSQYLELERKVPLEEIYTTDLLPPGK